MPFILFPDEDPSQPQIAPSKVVVGATAKDMGMISIVMDVNNEKRIIINDEIWEKLINKIKINDDVIYFRKELLQISENFELEIKNIIKSFLQYIILNYEVTTNFLSEIEMLVHETDSNSTYSIIFFFFCLKNFFNEN